MFPPKPTEDVTKWLESLLSSLARGGLEVSGDIGLDQIEDEKYSVMIRTPQPVPSLGWGPLRMYVRQYALASGWRVDKFRQIRGALLFLASKA